MLDPLVLELQEVMIYLMWTLGTKSGPMEEQQVLLTPEPSPASSFSTAYFNME